MFKNEVVGLKFKKSDKTIEMKMCDNERKELESIKNKKFLNATLHEKLRRHAKKIKYFSLSHAEEIYRQSDQVKRFELVQKKTVTSTRQTIHVPQYMISTNKTDYGDEKGNKKDKWKTYSTWTKKLDSYAGGKEASRKLLGEYILKILKSKNQSEWEDNLKTDNFTGQNFSEIELRAINSLIATISIAEPFRRDGAGKFSRAALKIIVDTDGKITFSEVFSGDNPLFTLAGKSGCNNWDNICSEDNDIEPVVQRNLIDYKLSDYLSESDMEE